MKKLFFLVVFTGLVGILIFQGGCDGVIVKDAGIQAAQTPYRIEKAKPSSEVKEEFFPERTEVVSKIPAGTYQMLKLGTQPVSPVLKNTVAKLQGEIRQGQVIFINEEKLLIETQGGDGKWYRGWVGPGTIFLAELKQNPKGAKEYKLVRIALCRNPVRSVEIRVFPAVVMAKTTITTAVTERYRDVNTKIDYTPALWTALGALLMGGVVGWFTRSRKKIPSV